MRSTKHFRKVAEENIALEVVSDVIPSLHALRERLGSGTKRLSNRRQTGSSVQTTGRDFNGPRMGNTSVEQKIAAIGKCADRMNVPKAIANLAKEAMEDILGAGAAYARDKSAQRFRRKSGRQNFNTQYETRSPGL